MRNILFVNGLGVLFIALILLLQNETPADKQHITNAPDCSSAKGFAKILCLTEALKSTLKEDQLAQLQLEYSKQNAAKWSNFPASFRNAERVGLSLGQMSSDQMKAAFALLKEVAGTTQNEGLDELQQLLDADDYLNENGGGKTYGTANYYIAFLGKPAGKGIFEIQFGGHHLAFANTYQDGLLTGATPSFRDVEPSGTFSWKGKSDQPLNQEQASLSEMLKSLSETQLTNARLNQTYSDILVGPQKDGRFPGSASGIKCSSLSPAQKKLVLSSIKTYVYDIDDKDAGAIMKKYTSELDSTYLSYSGTPELTSRNDYVRLDGPSLWIEYSCQGGIIIRGTTHPHSVWRDKSKDYGGN